MLFAYKRSRSNQNMFILQWLQATLHQRIGVPKWLQAINTKISHKPQVKKLTLLSFSLASGTQTPSHEFEKLCKQKKQGTHKEVINVSKIGHWHCRFREEHEFGAYNRTKWLAHGEKRLVQRSILVSIINTGALKEAVIILILASWYKKKLQSDTVYDSALQVKHKNVQNRRFRTNRDRALDLSKFKPRLNMGWVADRCINNN